ncbi:LLM class F420-dependent oxidoreductase [Mycobacterium sp. ACS1612]|uniref:TIGR03619 family F420-dependent LLM class oxidoreductase n=1 Tax=Mycobacterium sp. ACS1612 TaxID=1834117 RepID=UPI0007FD5433|nr:TIGR03619 family F420-dependent LLM class oxidoreductase [Mycobacterium sp. ACS1612]OBF36197.1 LLM class F420-dependent oxidoreductase [Mycobacterium sp. ACS1612]
MKYYLSTVFLRSRDVLEVAAAADEIGFHGLAIADHVVNIEQISSRYPYTGDGCRRWQPFTEWPDPWVMIGALAHVAPRLRFATTVYIAAMRNPYVAAKAIGTAALLSGGRVELGIGIGWCEEEFAVMGQRFDRRGARTDEMLKLFRALWQPGWTEFEGEFYRTPKLEMEPKPPPIPFLVGGETPAALRRAASNDGWVGTFGSTSDRAIEVARHLRELRAGQGLSMDGFTVLTPLVDARTQGDYERAEAAGVTHAIVRPWLHYGRGGTSGAEIIDAMRRFSDDIDLTG